MTPEPWSPWKTKSVLPPPLARAEAERQKDAIEDLLGTTLHPEFRSILRAVHGDLSRELNDNRKEG